MSTTVKFLLTVLIYVRTKNLSYGVLLVIQHEQNLERILVFKFGDFSPFETKDKFGPISRFKLFPSL